MKRAQAALEFLMTYGWALLVVLAAITALAYFGVLSADRFLPEKCTFPSGLACLDFASNGTQITIVMSNSLGLNMRNISLGIDGPSCITTATGNATLDNGETGVYVFTCAPASGRFHAALTVDYTNAGSSLSHRKIGDLVLAIP